MVASPCEPLLTLAPLRVLNPRGCRPVWVRVVAEIDWPFVWEKVEQNGLRSSSRPTARPLEKGQDAIYYGSYTGDRLSNLLDCVWTLLDFSRLFSAPLDPDRRSSRSLSILIVPCPLCFGSLRLVRDRFVLIGGRRVL